MRLRRLVMQNFRQHRSSVVEFDSGLTGIIGPNGAGKSTILEAVAWALYGNPAARGTRDGIRFQRAEPRAAVQVELEFDLSGHSFRIVRGLTMAELYQDGSAAPVVRSIGEVAEVVHRRLGMNRAEFFNTYFTGQKELNVMAAMKPSDRAQFLSRVLGYEKLRTAQELIREKRRLVGAEIAGLRSAMRDPEALTRLVNEAQQRCRDTRQRFEEAEASRLRTEEHLTELAPRWERAQKERDRLQEILSELRVTESEQAGLNRDAERIARDLAEVDSSREELEILANDLAPLDTVAEEFRRLEALGRHDGRRRALQESLRALEDEVARLRERFARVETAPAQEEDVTLALERTRAELQETEGSLEARRTEWVRDRQEAETKRQSLRTQYAELREQRDKLVALGDEGNCPTCMRPLRESYRTVIEMLDSQLETVLVDGNYFKSRLEQLEEMPEDVSTLDERRRAVFQEVGNLERNLAKVQHAVQEKQQLTRELAAKEPRVAALTEEIESIPGGYDQKRHDEVRGEIDRLAPLESRAARLGAFIEKEPQLHEEYAKSTLVLSELDARVVLLRRKRDEVGFPEKEYVALRTAHEFAASQMHQAEVASATAQSEFTSAESALATAKREREELVRSEQALASLQMQRRMHDELDRAFSDLRTDLNFQLRPELSALASSFLKDLTDDRYTELELDDAYKIVVLDESGTPRPVISGGEEDLANLSLRLAISQMIAERSGQTFSLLVLDEVFGSLDEPHRRSVVELLRRVRDRFEQVILITHIETVREGLDRVIAVSYDDDSGASVVEHVEDTRTDSYSDPADNAEEAVAQSAAGSGGVLG